MQSKSEFTVQNAYPYNQASPLRWIVSHIWRYKPLFLSTPFFYIFSHLMYAGAPVLIGHAADILIDGGTQKALLWASLGILAMLVADGISNLTGALCMENLAQKVERDAREELYTSLLGKSQVFHDRQRVGDIMARTTDDVRQLNVMISPGIFFIYETVMGFVIPITFMVGIKWQLLLVPGIFVLTYILSVREYVGRLNPVISRQHDEFGVMNAGLEESISGIVTVKASTQEAFERSKFRANARRFRNSYVQQGRIEAGYLPTLLYGVAAGLTFLHALILYRQGSLEIGGIIAVMGLMNVLRWPTFVSLFSLSLIQNGLASGRRILEIIKAETDLDENAGGHTSEVQGEIVFEDVSFAFGDNTVLQNISFSIQPGETVAIVGQTGGGKTTLTQLVNRTYDVTNGCILIDGVDVRDWNLTALRSQISKIEQDVFLFSRTVAENIAFGNPDATQEQIEQAAREAQAHDFIMSFTEGYQTKVGERGVTLSGGQRQRIALARAFLSNPRILILDDSTSAIDSATEDEIQKAIRRAQQGRTTLLITHRLSQIRWANHILVLDKGQLVASGSHEELLRTSIHYRRIFARYDMALPPLENLAQAV